jgi:hypothetical protein
VRRLSYGGVFRAVMAARRRWRGEAGTEALAAREGICLTSTAGLLSGLTCGEADHPAS